MYYSMSKHLTYLDVFGFSPGFLDQTNLPPKSFTDRL